MSAFQDGKGGMAFIEMTDFRTEAKRREQPPSPDAKK
jgi:hypothetical protein